MKITKEQLSKIIRLTAYSICDTCKYGEKSECNRICKDEYIASDKFKKKVNKIMEKK